MFIQSLEKNISHIVHNNVTYKVVKGIANVPQKVRDELTNFPNWHDLVEAIDEETLKLLHEDEKVDLGVDNGDKDSSDENTDKDPNIASLRDQAKELGIKGAARMKKEDLISAIEEASKQTSQE